MSEIKNEHITLLFKALSQILNNQDKINRHLGINKHDSEWGWDDDVTSELMNQCWYTANEYESEND